MKERLGKKVQLDPTVYPKLAGQTFEIVDQQEPKGTTKVFVGLADAHGRRVTHTGGAELWVDALDTLPAPATPAKAPVQLSMKAADRLDAAAREIQASTGVAYRDALSAASRKDLSSSKTWRDSIDVGTVTQLAYDKVKANPGMSPKAAVAAVLRSEVGRQEAGRVLNSLVEEHAREEGISLAAAAKIVAAKHPELVNVSR